MKDVIKTISELKDLWRAAKLKAGDHRGLKNRFSINERIKAVAGMQVYFDSAAKHDTRNEVYADLYYPEMESFAGREYSMRDLLAALKERTNPTEITIGFQTWNKERTDTIESKTVFEITLEPIAA